MNAALSASDCVSCYGGKWSRSEEAGVEKRSRCRGWVSEGLLTPKYISVFNVFSVCLQLNPLSCVHPAPPGYEMAAHLKREKQCFDLTPAVRVET